MLERGPNLENMSDVDSGVNIPNSEYTESTAEEQETEQTGQSDNNQIAETEENSKQENPQEAEAPEAQPDQSQEQETGQTDQLGNNQTAETEETSEEDFPQDVEKFTDKLDSLGLSWQEVEREVQGFGTLSRGKQILVLENLQQLTLGRVQEEASDAYRADVAESGWKGRLWKGVSKHWQIRKREKAKAEEIQKGGINTHKTALEQLTELTSDIPDVELSEDGTLAIGYAFEIEGGTNEQKKAVPAFNSVANEFARIPEEWSFSTASKKEHEAYEKAKQQYDEARRELLEAKKESMNYDENSEAEAEAMSYVNDAEFAVRMNQFLNTHPDAEKQLQNIKDEQAWKKAIKDIFVERAGYSVGGFVGRSVAVSSLGWIAAPVVAAGIGAWRGKGRAKETLAEREKAARKGEKDESKEAKNFIKADQAAGKLIKLIDNLNQEDQETGDNSKNKKSKTQKLQSLKARIDYTRGKLDAGRLNYGSQEHRLQNRYELLQALAEAEATFYAQNGEPTIKNKLDERLNNFLAHKEQKITKAQSDYIQQQMVKGATYGAGFALAGAAIREIGGQAAEAMDSRALNGVGVQSEGDTSLEAHAEESGGLAGYLNSKYDLPEKENFDIENLKKLKEYVGENLSRESSALNLYEDRDVIDENGGFVGKVGDLLDTNISEIDNNVQDSSGAGADETRDAEETGSQQSPDTEASAAEEAPEIKYQGGTSVWQEAENQFEQRFGNNFSKLDEAEKTWMIDMVKDKIAENPQAYSLEEGVDVDELSEKQLKSIDWEKAFAGIDQDNIDPNLTDAQKENIVENNETLREWVKDHPDKQLDSEKVEQILSGEEWVEADEASAGEQTSTENQARVQESKETAPSEPEPEQEPEELPKLLDEARKLNAESTDQKESALVRLWPKVVEYSKAENLSDKQEMAIEHLSELEPFADEYSDIKDMYVTGLERMIDEEINRGKGLLHFGSEDPEKISSLFEKLGKTMGLQENESELFTSWIKDSSEGLDREGLGKIDFYSKEGGKFQMENFKSEVDAFRNLADINSKEIAGGGGLLNENEWKLLKVAYTDEKGDEQTQILNVKLDTAFIDADTKMYCADSDGDGQPDLNWGDQGNKKLMSEQGLKEAAAKATGGQVELQEGIDVETEDGPQEAEGENLGAKEKLLEIIGGADVSEGYKQQTAFDYVHATLPDSDISDDKLHAFARHYTSDDGMVEYLSKLDSSGLESELETFEKTIHGETSRFFNKEYNGASKGETSFIEDPRNTDELLVVESQGKGKWKFYEVKGNGTMDDKPLDDPRGILRRARKDFTIEQAKEFFGYKEPDEFDINNDAYRTENIESNFEIYDQHPGTGSQTEPEEQGPAAQVRELESFRKLSDQQKSDVQDFLQADLKTDSVQETLQSLEGESNLAAKSKITSDLPQQDRQEYIRYKIQEIARNFVNNPDNKKNKNKLQKILNDAASEQGISSLVSSLKALF